MQLHVLGPAYGLPSFDAECIATIALLRRRAVDDWQLIPASSDFQLLPLLIDGDSRVSGFDDIAHHLDCFDISNALNAQQRADGIALSAFIRSRAQPLLDVSHYVSFTNFRTSTRASFTAILPWHANYLLPTRLRAEARLRTEHLGVSGIDVDDVHDDMNNSMGLVNNVGKQEGFEAEAQKRASLLLPGRASLRGMLRRPEHAAAFKLQKLTRSFFQPLEESLGDKDYLLSDEVNVVDCLAFGYLSLMLYPTVPQDWLASTMRSKHPKLIGYVKRCQSQFRSETKVEEVLSLSLSKTNNDVSKHQRDHHMSLPWHPPARVDLLSTLKMITFEISCRLPMVGSRTVFAPTTSASKQTSWMYNTIAMFAVFLATSGVGLSYIAISGRRLLDWSYGEEVHVFGRRRLADYGHIGEALAGLPSLMHSTGGLPSAAIE